jgi:hypothetical protein
MPSKNVGGLPSPWKEFLTEIDGSLSEPLELHCIGDSFWFVFMVSSERRVISTTFRRCLRISTLKK